MRSEMNEETDAAEYGRALTQMRKDRHARWHAANVALIEAAGVPFRWSSPDQTCMLFREKGKLAIDFYPHTGRWRVAGHLITHRGGARSFLAWYSRQHP